MPSLSSNNNNSSNADINNGGGGGSSLPSKKQQQQQSAASNNPSSNTNKPPSPSEVLNVNIGILGHVDSGKTSLVKTLSTLLSTAALDKSKQSRQRGMTLDLGFSCFFLDLPPHLKELYPSKSKLQMTLVDCPGHASLIRTIIGGAQIIDMVLLVVDAYKGWQAQTTECLVLAELTSEHLVVALNKIDMFPLEERQAKLEEAKLKVRQRLASTKFPNATMIGVSACVGGEKVAAAGGKDTSETSTSLAIESSNNNTILANTQNIDVLIDTLRQSLPAPNRRNNNSTEVTTTSSSSGGDKKGPNNNFYFAIDHCFPIKGMGTVLTGTCLSGSIKVNDQIEFPILGLERKIKSMQMFKRKTMQIQQGDRAGICVSSLDSNLMERGIAASPPGSVQLLKGAICLVKKIPYFPSQLPDKSKVHISVGHTTIMANVSFWGSKELSETQQKSSSSSPDDEGTTTGGGGDADENQNHNRGAKGLPYMKFDWNQDFLQQTGGYEGDGLNWAILDFQTPVYCPMNSLVIGSRLDTAVEKTTVTHKNKEKEQAAADTNKEGTDAASSCRLAFCGRLIEKINPSEDYKRIRLYNPKDRRGTISRLGDPHRRQDDQKIVRYEVFGTDLFKKETLLKPFLGMKLVAYPTGDIGELKSAFGTSGKFRVYFPAGTDAKEGDELVLPFKRFVHDAEKKMRQDDIILPKSRPGTRLEKQNKEKGKNKAKAKPIAVGEVEKIKGDKVAGDKLNTAIIVGFFTPEINIREKIGSRVYVPSTKEEGTIAGAFGKAGKCKVIFENGISESAVGSKAELFAA